MPKKEKGRDLSCLLSFDSSKYCHKVLVQSDWEFLFGVDINWETGSIPSMQGRQWSFRAGIILWWLDLPFMTNLMAAVVS